LNRPASRNALDIPLRLELGDAVESAMADSTVRAIVLTGAGGSFCSGGDISTMQRMPPAEGRPRAEAAQRVVRALWAGGKPVVAAVEGAAFGAGLALALACDRIVAAKDARFGAAFVRVGLAGDMGIFATLPARLGPAAAKQILMFGKQFSAPEALELGLIDVTAPTGGALAAAVADAATLAAGPPLALAAIKSLLTRWPSDPVTVLDREVEQQVALFDSDDLTEGAAAFHERRSPVFGGGV
jgi:enoyl-CoA hydratase/carnithine racemase